MFFSNFEGYVFGGKKYDEGILNLRSFMDKSTKVLLRCILSIYSGIYSLSFPKSDGKCPKKTQNRDLAKLNCKGKI